MIGWPGARVRRVCQDTSPLLKPSTDVHSTAARGFPLLLPGAFGLWLESSKPANPVSAILAGAGQQPRLPQHRPQGAGGGRLCALQLCGATHGGWAAVQVRVVWICGMAVATCKEACIRHNFKGCA